MGPGGAEARLALDRALARRATAAESVRLGVLVALFGGLLAFAPAAPWLVPDVMGRLFHGRLDLTLVLGFLGLELTYALGSLALARWYADRGRAAPRALAFVQAAMEASLPTAVLFAAGHLVDPAHALTAPPLFLYFLILALSALRLDPWLTLFTGAVSIAGYAAVVAWALPRSVVPLEPMLTAPVQHAAKALLMAAITAATALVARTIRQGTEESVVRLLERDRVAELFGRHVSPAVADHLLAAPPDTGGEERDVSVLFLDIRDFTTLAESRAPGEVVSLLNALFAPLADAVDEHGGFVNKFLGDGFMAVFGAPLDVADPRGRAVAAAREILARVDAFNAGRPGPPIRVGIGVHAGRVTTGSVGSARRREYTVIGDVVNVAARVEGLNRALGTTALVTEAVVSGAVEGLEDLGEQPVKGRAAAVRVYRLA